MRETKATEGQEVMREHLLRILLEQVERTFSTEGQGAGLRLVAALFERMDDAALRELAYQYGLMTEADLEPEEENRRE